MVPAPMSGLEPRLLAREPWPVLDVVAWLAREGRFQTQLPALITALAERLHAAGAPVSRLYVAARTLHPQVMATTVEWLVGGKLHVTDIPHVFANIPEFVGSPIDRAATTGQPYRRRLTDLDRNRDHAILVEVAERGFTDYLALPIVYADRQYHPRRRSGSG